MQSKDGGDLTPRQSGHSVPVGSPFSLNTHSLSRFFRTLLAGDVFPREKWKRSHRGKLNSQQRFFSLSGFKIQVLGLVFSKIVFIKFISPTQSQENMSKCLYISSWIDILSLSWTGNLLKKVLNLFLTSFCFCHRNTKAAIYLNGIKIKIETTIFSSLYDMTF